MTHVDAHADLGLGDPSYDYLMTNLLYASPEDRLYPEQGWTGLADSSFLAFVIACRWVAELEYVFNDRGGNDIHPYLMEGFDADAEHIQLAAMPKGELQKLMGLMANGSAQVDHLAPRVPFWRGSWREFQADLPFDVVCLARSPAFTPKEADPLFGDNQGALHRGDFPALGASGPPVRWLP